MTWFVYILECSDSSYYIGATSDLRRRLKEHQLGRGGSWTRVRRPVALKYSEKLKTKKEAELRERQIKGWSRRKKKALMKGKVLDLSRFS